MHLQISKVHEHKEWSWNRDIEDDTKASQRQTHHLTWVWATFSHSHCKPEFFEKPEAYLHNKVKKIQIQNNVHSEAKLSVCSGNILLCVPLIMWLFAQWAGYPCTGGLTTTENEKTILMFLFHAVASWALQSGDLGWWHVRIHMQEFTCKAEIAEWISWHFRHSLLPWSTTHFL